MAKQSRAAKAVDIQRLEALLVAIAVQAALTPPPPPPSEPVEVAQ
jgi:hypothetical protein